jgi:hypothetical protein
MSYKMYHIPKRGSAGRPRRDGRKNTHTQPQPPRLLLLMHDSINDDDHDENEVDA